MAKTKEKAPTPLERFLEVDFAVLQRVLLDGRCDMQFETDNQAAHTKLRLWRLRNSLLYYKPNEPLSKAVVGFMFKKQGSRLSIIDRVRSSEYQVMLDAAAGKRSIEAIADPVERNKAAEDAELGNIDFAAAERLLLEDGEQEDDEANPSRD